MFEMFPVEIRNGGDGRRQTEERPVALVRFRHEEIAPAKAGVTSQRIHLAPDHHGGIQPPLRQHIGHHRRCRSLTVGAGNGDAEFQPHQLRQHLGPRNHGNLLGLRRHHLGVLGRHGGGDDHHLRLPHIRLLMADKDASAKLFQSPRRIGRLQIRARHFIAQGQQHLGDAAHPRAPDAD